MMERSREWNAVWICDPAFLGVAPLDLFHKQYSKKALPPHPEALLDRHMLARKVFALDNPPVAPFIHISADDFYRLYVNGVFVAEGPASSYHFRYRYDRIDLSGLLVEGRNVIAVHVYYQGLVNRVWVSGDCRQGLVAELFDDGHPLLSTDSSWRISVPSHKVGGRFGYDTQFAENIDARIWPDSSWRTLPFDDSSWTPATENPADDHVLARSEIPPVVRRSVKPLSVTTLAGGRLVYDFGSEVVGYFRCSAWGSSGDVVRIRHGEELSPDASVRVMRCNCDYKEDWTLSGRSPDQLEYFDYKAFRYVELELPSGVRIDDVEVLSRSYPLGAAAASFSSSDPLLKGIWDICAKGVELGSQGAFLDCPSREKGQYLGDMTVTASAQFHLSGDSRLYGKALRDFADSTFICPGMMAVAPSAFMQEIADYSLQYPLQVLDYYRKTGDREGVEALLPYAEGVMEHFRRYERTDGLLENVIDKWNLVDWPANLRDDYDFKLDESDAVGKGPHTVLNAFYAMGISALDELRAHFGKRTSGFFPRLRNSFIKAFHRGATGLFVDSPDSSHSSLHSNALALYAGLAPEGAISKIVSFIEGKGFACGVYMSYFVLKALARAGRHDVAYRLMLNEGPRSWVNMLREGATSCFEAWGKEQKWNTSLCHPWAAAPVPVMVEDFIGLQPLKPGYAELGLFPRLPATAADFSLSLHLPTADLIFSKDGLFLHVDATAKIDALPLVHEASRVVLRAGVPFRLSLPLKG